MKLIELNTNPDILISSNVLTFKSEYVYIPITGKILVKQNDEVKIGEEIIENEYCPVSGIVLSIVKRKTVHGLIDTICIQNNFKDEKKDFKKSLKSLKKSELDKSLKLFNINIIKQKYFVLNCIDDEAYVATFNFYLFNYLDLFLELLDIISKFYNIKIILAIKSVNSENINKLMNQLGMYPNIILKMVPNLYLLGKNNILLDYLYLNSDEVVIMKSDDFYDLSNIVQNQKTNEILITISGDNLVTPSIVRARVGTSINQIIEDIKLKDNSCVYFINGLMSGRKSDIDDLIITKDLYSIIIMKKQETIKSTKCINCGECINICPVNLNPLLFSNKRYLEYAKKKCIKCGLCSYICPSYINFKGVGEE